MSYTRKYLNAFGSGFKKIKDFACSPWDWICDNDTSCIESSTKAANKTNSYGVAATAPMVGLSIDITCLAAKMCCCAPCACVCSAVTIPTATATAGIYSALGIVGLVGVGFADLATGNCVSAPAQQEMPVSTTHFTGSSLGHSTEASPIRANLR